MNLRGVFAPATTPFDPHTDEVDSGAMVSNLEHWLRAPLAGVVLFGSTGEGVLLDPLEKQRLLGMVRPVIPEDRLLLVGTGAESTRATIRMTQVAAREGADAVLVQPPAFYRPQMTPEALREHFTAVADAAPVPVILYQVPPRFSTVELAAGLVGALVHHPNIIGIKDSTGELKSLGSLVDACGPHGTVLVGSGAMLYGALETGARGGIVALALLAPHESAEICEAYLAGDLARAGRIQERIAPVHQEIVGKLGVPGVKAALDLLGLAGGAPRSPLPALRERDRRQVGEALRKAGLLEAPD